MSVNWIWPLAAAALVAVWGACKEPLNDDSYANQRSNQSATPQPSTAIEDNAPDTAAGRGPQSPAPGTEPPSEPETKTVVEPVYGLGDNRLKNLNQLRAALRACIGSSASDNEKFIVRSSMLVPVNAQPVADAQGRLPFLPNENYKNALGKDILDILAAHLLDPAAMERYAAAADRPEVTYMQALGTVANVVAHQCDVHLEECKCATAVEGRAFLIRCLPHLDSSTDAFDRVAADFTTSCARGEAGMRAAIASLIASLAFAVTP